MAKYYSEATDNGKRKLEKWEYKWYCMSCWKHILNREWDVELCDWCARDIFENDDDE
jgi:ribosomal protein L33